MMPETDPTQHAVVELARELIKRPSITPNDQGCQQLMANCLKPLGFEITHLPFGKVQNLWARRGSTEPLLLFAGHTDVVPPGPLSHWRSPPFEAVVQDDQLIGRGAADMKGALAAMLVAIRNFVREKPKHSGSIGLLITSDEEGPATDGTKQVIQYLAQQGITPTWCIVGEPSSATEVGDTIRVGRRGSLHATLTIEGQQGHIAYPDEVKNPIPVLANIIAQLDQIVWDHAQAPFPPTGCQVSGLKAGDGTENMVPKHATAQINWRFAPASSPESIQSRTQTCIEACLPPRFSYQVNWRLTAKPFGNASPDFLTLCDQSIRTVTGQTPRHSTAGGTSDGRFIAPTGCQVVEIGLRHSTIHQANEMVACEDLRMLCGIYEGLLGRVLQTKKQD